MTKITATLTSKGQMTVPKSVRRALRLKSGMKFEVTAKEDSFIVRPRREWAIFKHRGILKDQDDGRSTDEIIEQAKDQAMRTKFSKRVS